jgi:hypothetical protein
MRCSAFFFFFIICLVCSGFAAAVTYTWIGGTGTAWSTQANWSPATGYPGKTATDIAVFNATGGSHACQLDASYSFANIQIFNSYTGNFDFNGKTLTLTTPSGNIQFDLGSPGIFQNIAPPSKIRITISSNRNFLPPAQLLMLPDIVVQNGNASNNRTVTQITNELICNSLTISGATGTRTPIFSAGALAFKTTSLTLDSGNFTGGAAGHDTITGNVTISPNTTRGGVLTAPTGLATGFFIVNSNLTMNAGTFTGTTSNINVAGVWSIPTTAAATITTGHLTAGSWSMAAGTFSVSTGVVTVTNNFSLSGGTFTESGAGTINLGGNWSNTGGTFSCGTGIVVFNGNAGPYSIAPNANNFYKLKFNGTGAWAPSASITSTNVDSMVAGTLNLGTTTLTCGAGLVGTGGTINASTANIAVTGNVTLSGATFSAPGNSNTFSFTGKFSKTAGTFTHNSGTISFAGTASNSIATDNSADFNNIANTSAYCDTIKSNIKFNNFSMTTAGKLSIGSAKKDTSTGTITITIGTLDLQATDTLAFPGNLDMTTIHALTTTTSSHFLFYGGSGVTQTLKSNAVTLPVIDHPGAGTLQFQNAISSYGLNQTGANGPTTSILDFNGYNLTLPSGNFSATNGNATTLKNLANVTIKATTGNITFSGTSTTTHLLLDGAPSWYADVITTANLAATNCDIGHGCIHATYKNGTAVLSTDLTTNCAGPPNWVFLTTNVWTGATSASWSLPGNWSLGHSPTSTESAQFDGTCVNSCVLDATCTIKNLTFLGTFARNFSFGTTANVLTIGGATADFSMSASATTTLGTGTLTFTSASAQLLTPPPLSTQMLPAIMVTSGTANPLSVSTNALNCGDITLTSSKIIVSTSGTTNQVGNINGSSGSTLDIGTANVVRANGTTVNFSNIALTSDPSDTLDFNGGSTQTFSPASQTFPGIKHSGNAKLAVTPTATWAAGSFVQNGGSSCSIDFGGQDFTTADDFTITNGNTGSFTSGTLSGRLITVGGDASFNGTSAATYLDMDAASSGWQLKATGACNASYAHIAYCNASGTAGIATSSQDLSSTGANTNWTFITNWIAGSASTWQTAASWSSGQVPTLLTTAAFDNNGPGNCQLTAPTTARSVTLTNLYMGTFDFSGQTLTILQGADFTTGGATVTTGGSIIFNSGADAGSYLFIPDSGMTIPTLTKNGNSTITLTNYPITVTSAFSLGGGTWSWGAGLTSTVPSLSPTAGTTVNFGTSNLRVASGDVKLNSCASVTGNMGSIAFLGSGNQTLTPINGTTTLPKIFVSGYGKLTLGGNLKCNGLIITFSQFDFSIYSLTIAANSFRVSGGNSSTFSNLGGKAISVTGDASFSGTPNDLVNLNASAWSIAVSGALTATYATVANCNANGAARGKADYGCVNGNGNTNWDYAQFQKIWGQTGQGNVLAGISNEGGTMFLAISATPDVLSCNNSSDGSIEWTFATTGNGTISQPEYYYSGTSSTYNVAFTGGPTSNLLYVIQDNGLQSTQMPYSPISLPSSNAGDPIASPDQSEIFITSGGHVTIYNASTGAAVYDRTDQANISSSADLVIFSDAIYDATTDGKMEKRDYNGVPIATWTGAGSIDLPFAISDNIAYLISSNKTLYAVDVTNLSATKWTYGLSAVAAVPLFTSHNTNGVWVAYSKTLDKVVGNGTATPTVIWTYGASKAITGAPVAMGNGSGPVYLSINNGNYLAVDDATGLNFNANWPITSPSGAGCSPWIDVFTWKVMFGTANGNLDAIPIDY